MKAVIHPTGIPIAPRGIQLPLHIQKGDSTSQIDMSNPCLAAWLTTFTHVYYTGHCCITVLIRTSERFSTIQYVVTVGDNKPPSNQQPPTLPACSLGQQFQLSPHMALRASKNKRRPQRASTYSLSVCLVLRLCMTE